FVSTIDIDNAFAFAHKGLKRNLGGLAKDVFNLRLSQVAQRMMSHLNEEKDPYNTFKFINSLSKETQTALRYFVLIGDYSSYDKNPHYNKVGFRKLLKGLSNQHEVGLHPSYESFNHLEKIEIEKKRLEDIIEKKVISVRCHFLRIKLPETYRVFIKAGITDDYTMIYASQSGFRTGLCTPFPWFDLERNEITSLTIHPSTMMEGTLRDYNGYSVEHANATIHHLLSEVKKQGGEFVSVWHNDSFVPEQVEWIEVYKKLLQTSKN
ncbi:MAG: polysaccharide deacetylase family protein, partial [Bacteroidia bacterium]|nr:polysaccharide deacetylase family protein [Bacteroidia bacterium]